MSSFFVFIYYKWHYISTVEHSIIKFSFFVFILPIYQNSHRAVINKIISFLVHDGTLLLTHLNYDSSTKIPLPSPLGNFFCGTPSETTSYTLNYICAKFGAFTRLVTIFVIFRPNRPDYCLLGRLRNRCR